MVRCTPELGLRMKERGYTEKDRNFEGLARESGTVYGSVITIITPLGLLNNTHQPGKRLATQEYHH